MNQVLKRNAIRAIFVITFCIFTLNAIADSEQQGNQCKPSVKSIAIGGVNINYLEIGQGEPILLLHGLFAQKEQWSVLMCSMSLAGFNVIAPDLPGYATSLDFPISVYQLENQAQLMNDMMRALGKTRIHIAGSSMGGTIAAFYARAYPKEIKTLAFIGAPLGIISWSPQMKVAIFSGVNPFIPISLEQFDLEMKLIFYQVPPINAADKLMLVNEYKQNNQHYQQIWDIINFYNRALNSAVVSPPPTLILWGANDSIFSIEGMQILQARYKYSRAQRMAEAGHLPMLEKPNEVSMLYKAFLNKKP